MNENYLSRIFQEAFRKVAVRYGFVEESLPFYADYESYISLCPDRREELIKLINPDGKILCLRMDQTVMAVLHEEQKSIAKNEMKRIFYFDNTFKINNAKGILEEVPQFGLEIFQEECVTADCETISAVLSIMEELGFSKYDFKIEISNARFPRQVVKGAIPEAQRSDEKLLRRVLKLVEKKNKPAIKSLSGMDGDYDTKILTAIVDAFGEYNATVESIKEYNLSQGALKALAELSELKDMLSAYGIENVEVDLGATNRFHYYDSFMCRIYSLKTGKIIAGGGRYDYLGSSDMKGCGISFYDENIEELMMSLDVHQNRDYDADAIIISGSGLLGRAAKLASELRKKGERVIVMSDDTSNFKTASDVEPSKLAAVANRAGKTVVLKEDRVFISDREKNKKCIEVSMDDLAHELGVEMEVYL